MSVHVVATATFLITVAFIWALTLVWYQSDMETKAFQMKTKGKQELYLMREKKD